MKSSSKRNMLAVAIPCAVLCLLSAAPMQSQAKTPTKRVAQPVSVHCAEILKATSADYVAHESPSQAPEEEIRAIETYGKCYDERTERLAASLARRGNGPKKVDVANLNDMEVKLRNFTTAALADSNPPGDTVKAAYASLYQKQFRYEFYESYEERATKPKATSGQVTMKPKPTAPPARSSPTTKVDASTTEQSTAPLPEKPRLRLEGVPASTAPAKDSATPASTRPPASNSKDATTAMAAPATDGSVANAPAAKEIDPFTKAKNHFGELLGALPPDTIHEVHSSFGKLFSGNPVSEELKVEIYTYAIFLLEGPKDKPFAPPPF